MESHLVSLFENDIPIENVNTTWLPMNPEINNSGEGKQVEFEFGYDGYVVFTSTVCPSEKNSRSIDP